METLEILELIQKGESSKVQFKERIKDAHSISQEMVAFANLKGGTILIGVNDKTGELNGLSFVEIQKYNNILSDASSNNVKPSIFIETEQAVINNQTIIIISVKEGSNKPYKDKDGIIWIKNGSDKRKVTSNEELARLLQESKSIFADEQLISNTSVSDIDTNILKYYILKSNISNFEEITEKLPDNFTPNDLEKYETDVFFNKINFQNTLKKFLQNIRVLNENELTLSGLLLFCDNLQRHRQLFTIDCVTFPDNNTNSTTYVDTEIIAGSYYFVFHKAMQFVNRNLRKIPSQTGFNVPPKSEIPTEVFEELIVNALVHRNYFINSTIKIFVFPNRIEIISPGVLPNSLTVENVINGIAIQRNPNLHSLAKYILPYKGYGTGIKRAVSMYANIQFINNLSKEQFIAIISK